MCDASCDVARDIIVLILWGGWKLYNWEKYRNDEIITTRYYFTYCQMWQAAIKEMRFMHKMNLIFFFYIFIYIHYINIQICTYTFIYVCILFVEMKLWAICECDECCCVILNQNNGSASLFYCSVYNTIFKPSIFFFTEEWN